LIELENSNIDVDVLLGVLGSEELPPKLEPPLLLLDVLLVRSESRLDGV